MLSALLGVRTRCEPASSVESCTQLDGLRRSRRHQRSELYAEILQLRASGMAPRQIAPRMGMNVRTVERWLAAGGEPEHRRPPTRSVLDSFQDYLELRWQEGQRNGVAAVDRNQAPRL